MNHDDRLNLREMLGAAERLAALDHDGDGVVIMAEISDRLACIVLRGARAEDATPFNPFGRERRPAADAPRWLTAMDQNADGEISPNEFLGTSEQFTQMDLNADGILDAGEVRDQAESAGASTIPSAAEPVSGP